jgi:adenosylhomocysteine nucleosidase
MEDVVAFAALAWEARAVLDALQGVEGIGRRVWRGYLGDGAAVRVLQIGVGLDRAERAAAAAAGAGLYLSCGCAGGLLPGLRAGDVVVADRILALDRGGGALHELPTDAGALADWSAARGFDVRVGAVASSPIVLATADGKRVAAGHGALAVDMESAAVASVARERGVRCTAVKVVLDEAGDAVGFPGGELVDPETGEIDVRRGVTALALRPHWWPRTMRLARQHRVAERRLRAYLAALCSAGLDAFGLAPNAGLSRALVG